ncbi:hypothetical protein [Nocardioides jensenii]|uniref:hypothetical protein n=1 Tax=Nocardioides jensenii TaxID=1843 RepID=UPI0008368B70|nr:hypothetical protein [Nocardioides jensenii]
MAYQVLTTHGINQESGLVTERTTFAERLQAALNNQKTGPGMELVAIDSAHPDGPLYVFAHESDRR